MGAYDLYLRAVPLFWTFSREPMAEALDFLERAAVLDPDFGLALAMAATGHRLSVDFGWADEGSSRLGSGDVDFHRARGLEMAHHALRAAGDDARALAHAASALMGLDPDLDQAADLIARALALNPGCAYAWLVSGLLNTRLGEPGVAIAHLETAMRLDPLSGVRTAARWNTGLALFQQGRFAEALPLLRGHSTAVSPLRHAVVAATAARLGMMDEAREALALFHEVTALSTDEVARIWFRKPEHRERFRDGIAMAASSVPAAGPAGC